jgi:hypothetical protein
MMKHRDRDSIWPNAAQLVSMFFTILFTLLSLLCKELGITLTMMCAYWDFFLVEELSLRDLILLLPFMSEEDEAEESVDGVAGVTKKKERSKRSRVLSWFMRTVLLGVSTVIIGVWRLRLNGGNPPFLRYNANRHGIEVDFSKIPPELTHGNPYRLIM